MKFSIPKISIPNISIPNIPISDSIDAGSIKNAITSAIPDLSSIVGDLGLEGIANDVMSDIMGGGIELPSEIKGLLK